MNPQENVIFWLVLGIVPYKVRRLKKKSNLDIEIRALFWSLTYHEHKRKHYDIAFRIAIIEKARSIVWSVINQLKETGSNYEDLIRNIREDDHLRR